MCVSLSFSRAAKPSLPAQRKARVAIHVRARRAVLTRAEASKEPRRPNDTTQGEDGFFSKALRSAAATWSKFDLQQRAFTVVAGAALLAALPQILTVAVIALERVLIGGLLAVEAALAGLLLGSARLVVVLGVVVLLATGAYLFLFKKQT